MGSDRHGRAEDEGGDHVVNDGTPRRVRVTHGISGWARPDGLFGFQG